jgi:mono/diheme cytochrome c family protein
VKIPGPVSLCFLLVTVWAQGRGPIQQAPAKATSLINPLRGTVPAQRAGAKLFERECAPCHGLHREGLGKAPSLNRPEVYRAASGTLFWVLRNGSLYRGMPSFAHLPESERWQIVTFLQEEGEGAVR